MRVTTLTDRTYICAHFYKLRVDGEKEMQNIITNHYFLMCILFDLQFCHDLITKKNRGG